MERTNLNMANVKRAAHKLSKAIAKEKDISDACAAVLAETERGLKEIIRINGSDDDLFEVLHNLENRLDVKELRRTGHKSLLKSVERAFDALMHEAKAARPTAKLTPELTEMLHQYYVMQMKQALLKKPVPDEKELLERGWQGILAQSFASVEQGKKAIDLGVAVFAGTHKGSLADIEREYRDILGG